MVALDDGLVAAIDQARRRRSGEEIPHSGGSGAEGTTRGAGRVRAHSSLSPREIQSRLRAGSTIAEVASQAGVDDEWVMRFAAPILAEQAQVVASAQRLTLVKARRGPSIESLAPSVQWNLSDRGVNFSDDVFADSWSAFNLHGARWAVRFAYTSRKRRQVAEWEVDLRERSLVARNRLATDLGHVEEGRRRPSLEPADPGALDAATSAPVGRVVSKARPGRAASGGGRAASAGGRAPARPAAKRAAGTARPAVKKGAEQATAAAMGAKKVGAAVGKRAGATGGPVKGATATATGASAAKAGARGAAATAGARGAAAKAGTPVAGAKAGGPATRAGGGRAAGAASSRGTASAGAARSTPASRSGREPSPRKARPAEKADGDTPGASDTGRRGLSPTAEPVADRPSHLARPPSPMKMANRATTYASQRLTATNARPAPPAPQPARTASGRQQPGAAMPESSHPGNPRFEPAPAPRRPPGPSPAKASARPAGDARRDQGAGERPPVIGSGVSRTGGGAGNRTTGGSSQRAGSSAVVVRPQARPGEGPPPAVSGRTGERPPAGSGRTGERPPPAPTIAAPSASVRPEPAGDSGFEDPARRGAARPEPAGDTGPDSSARSGAASPAPAGDPGSKQPAPGDGARQMPVVDGGPEQPVRLADAEPTVAPVPSEALPQPAPRTAVAPPIGQPLMASRPEAVAAVDERPAVVILAPRAADGGVARDTPEEEERRARLASASRLRSALTGAAATPGGAGGRGRPRRA